MLYGARWPLLWEWALTPARKTLPVLGGRPFAVGRVADALPRTLNEPADGLGYALETGGSGGSLFGTILIAAGVHGRLQDLGATISALAFRAIARRRVRGRRDS